MVSDSYPSYLVPVVSVAQTLITDVNRLLRTAYTTALEANTTPYTNRHYHTDNAWFCQPISGRTWANVMLFEELVKRGHIPIRKWFLDEEAYPIIGDTVYCLLHHIFWPGLWYSEVTEMILTPYLYLKASIGWPNPDAVRHLIAHGTSLADPTEGLVCWANEGSGPTAQILVDCGVFGVSHQVLDRSAYYWTIEVAQVFLNNGMDVQTNPNEF